VSRFSRSETRLTGRSHIADVARHSNRNIIGALEVDTSTSIVCRVVYITRRELTSVELDIIDVDLIRAGEELKAARKAANAAYADAQRAALAALHAGATEVAVADVLGVDRMTVRKWAGKRQ
jgi:hypothetical protein